MTIYASKSRERKNTGHISPANNGQKRLVVTDSNVKEKFEKFMSHRGKDQTTKKIWFAIMPQVEATEGANRKKNVDGGDDDFGPRRREKYKETKIDPERLTLATLKAALKIMDKSKVTAVFSMKANNKTGFDNLSRDVVMDYKNKLSSLDNSHAVFAYPNFTIMRNRKIDVVGDKLDVPAVYVEACYAAAGLLAGSQQADYLEQHGYKNCVNRRNVCARVDLEEMSPNLLTNFNRELGTRWSHEIKEEIDKEQFGFVFCSDEAVHNGKLLQQAYVYCARNLSKNEKTGRYNPIYKTLVMDFVYAFTNTFSSKKPTDYKRFVSNDVYAWKEEIKQSKNASVVNFILRNGEDIRFDNEAKKLSVVFNDDEQPINDIEVVSD